MYTGNKKKIIIGKGVIMQRYPDRSNTRLFFTFFVLLFTCTACTTVYYATWEKLGKHKRDLLKDNVIAVKEEQVEAQEEFKDALTRLKELSGFHGGDLEDMYYKLKDDYDECKARADAIRERIDKINEIASDLFAEWEEEINSMSNASMKRKDRQRLINTKRHFASFARTLERAERSLGPVLTAFNDQVLYLKHNLNAKAIAGLQGEVASIETDVSALIRDMNKSIAEAYRFIKNME
jgi:hypothetical protein